MEAAITYTRVSDPSQEDGSSLDTQHSFVKAYIERKDYELDRQFVEPGVSAKTTKRPALMELIEYCRVNRGRIKVLVIHKVDRLARNTVDYYTIKLKLVAYGVRIESASEPLEDTPVGRLTESMLANIAQFDNEIRAERSLWGMTEAVKQGRWIFSVPLGYQRVRVGGGPTIEPDPTSGPIISEVFERLASGRWRPLDVRTWLEEQGLPLARSRFYKMLFLPVYLGRMEVFGLSVQGAPPFVPLVSQETFYAAQGALKPKNMPKTYDRDNPDFPLRGTLRCRCGAILRGAWSHGRHRRYAYYRCASCRQVNLPRDVVEQDFMAELATGKLTRIDRDGLGRLLRDLWQEQSSTFAARRISIEKELANLRGIQSAIVRKNALEIISDVLAKQELKELDKQIAEKTAELKGVEPVQAVEDELIDFGCQFLAKLPSFWRRAPTEEQKALQRFAFPSGTTYCKQHGLRTAQDDPLPLVKRSLHALQSATVPLDPKSANQFITFIAKVYREFGPKLGNKYSLGTDFP